MFGLRSGHSHPLHTCVSHRPHFITYMYLNQSGNNQVPILDTKLRLIQNKFALNFSDLHSNMPAKFMQSAMQ